MRVITGTLGGRIFESPASQWTHPMSDKMRGALFNSLGDITGLTAFDPFAGSGALSFEALSRGASEAVLTERDRSAQAAITQNILQLHLSERAQLVHASAAAWLGTNPTKTFQLIFCDPPYDDLQPELLDRISERLTSDGTLVLSWPGKRTPPAFEGLACLTQHNYGDGQLVFYKRIA